MITQRLSAFTVAGFLATAACDSPPARRVERSVPTTDPRKCAIVPRSLASARDTAVWCAEEFIARNGYTTQPAAADTAFIALESIEWDSSITSMVHARHNSLAPRAMGVCSSERSPGGAPPGGYIVAFRAHDGTYARAVIMSAAYSDLRVQHTDFDTTALDSPRFSCARVREITTRLHN